MSQSRFSASVVAPLTLGLSLALLGPGSGSARAESLGADEAAAYFGRIASVEGMRLSPDGQKISMLARHEEGFPLAVVRDLTTGKGGVVLASDVKQGADISRCSWANDTRLLCGYFGIWNYLGDWLASTRLVSVDADGKDIKVLAEKQQKGNVAMHQDEVIDLLPDEPSRIWIEFDEGSGEGVSEVDIYKSRLKMVVRPKASVWGYMSDGRGEVRIRADADRAWTDLEYRLAGEKRFHRLHRYEAGDLDDIYDVIGFASDPNDLIVLDWKDGRRAIFTEHLDADPSQPRERKVRPGNRCRLYDGEDARRVLRRADSRRS